MNHKYALPQDGGLKKDQALLGAFSCFEKIPTHVFDEEREGVNYLADLIVKMVSDYSKRQSTSNSFSIDQDPFVLGLSTGRTPIGLYRELVSRYKKGEIDFSNVSVISLDEFYPIEPGSINSRNQLIHEVFLDHVNISENNIHLPQGNMSREDIADFCKAYEQIASRINLLIVGMGEQGQIGFNEVGSFATSRTRLVRLSHNSMKVQASILKGRDVVPNYAITIGLGTLIRAEKITLMAWGEDKAHAVKMAVEGDMSSKVPASFLQAHTDIQIVIDKAASSELTREVTPWLVGECEWTPKFIRKAVLWLCELKKKPILKLTYNDYIENSLSSLLEVTDMDYSLLNIKVFNELQNTITGWPGGKPNSDDSTRPVPSTPHGKRVLIFSPHPDDDVISMGGTFIRLVEQGHDVHVAYQVSGNVAVHDDVVLQSFEAAFELGYEDKYEEVKTLISSKVKGEPEPRELLEYKGAIRRSEAKSACRSFGLDASKKCHFLNLPFYETGAVTKGIVSDADIDIIVAKLREIQPNQIYAAGDLADPHGTHRVCFEAILDAIEIVKEDEWMKDCHLWMYRGAWMEWDLSMVDMAVPLSPQEMIHKRHAIYRHLSQKDIVPFPGDDSREFWQRAEDRTQNTAKSYNDLGMAEYQAIEVFVKMF